MDVGLLMISGPPDFERVKLIGQGDVGKVYLVRLKSTRSLFAMKILSKTEMIARNKVLMLDLNCPIDNIHTWLSQCLEIILYLMAFCAAQTMLN
jgi:hypothetical protein